MSVLVPTPSNVQSVLNGATAGDDIDFRGSATFPAFDVPKRLRLHGNGTAKVAGTGYPIRVRSGAGGSLVEGFGSVSGSTAKDHALVLIERAADVTISNNVLENGAQYGIRTYDAERYKILDNTIRRVAVGVETHRLGTNGQIVGNTFQDIDRMLTDDGGPATNGGDAIQLYDSAGGILIEDNDFERTRAKTAGGVSWKYDGGAFTGYGKCGPLTFRNNRIRNCLNVLEVGTDTARGGVPTGWVIEDNEAWGNPDVAPDESRSCVGFFLRSNNGFVIRRNKLHELDDFFLRLVATGGYAGSMVGNLVTDNDVWVKPGASSTYGLNRAYEVHSSVVPATWGKIEGNRIWFDAAKSPEVAQFTGKGATRVLATWKSWTGWGTGETWGPAVPVDSCAVVKAERDAALAALQLANSAVASLTAERDNLSLKVEAAREILSS